MADVTFVRGYGFPRGSSMDYAGLGTYERPGGVGADGCPINTVRVGGRCVPFSQLSGYAGRAVGDCGCGGSCGGCGQPAPALARFARFRAHDPSLFAPVPALDGYGVGDDFEEEDITPNPMVGPAAPTPEEWAAMKGGGSAGLVGLGLLAIGAALFLKW